MEGYGVEVGGPGRGVSNPKPVSALDAPRWRQDVKFGSCEENERSKKIGELGASTQSC